MPTVAEVVRRYGPAYLERFGDRMPAEHKKVLRAIAACRTGELGTVLYRCEDCGRTHAMGRSCGNRHCPSCQRDKAEAWLEKQIDRLLPCPYFLVTFTLPAELRDVARGHQRVVYAALFEASSEALRALAADPKYVGTDRLGFFGVLHTWGRTLEYHPHVHYVVPGGGLSADGDRWLPSRADFLVPVKALSIVFRAKFRDLLGARACWRRSDPAVWRRDWVVHCQPAGDGRRVAAVPGAVRLPRGDRRPSDRLVRRRPGDVHLSPGGIEPAAEDDAGRDGVPAAVPAARAAVGVPEGAALRLPEPGGGGGAGAGAVADRGVGRGDVRAAVGPAGEEPAAPPGGRACPVCGGRLVRLGFVPAPAPAVFDTS